jgi:hypothetical protein
VGGGVIQDHEKNVGPQKIFETLCLQILNLCVIYPSLQSDPFRLFSIEIIDLFMSSVLPVNRCLGWKQIAFLHHM